MRFLAIKIFHLNIGKNGGGIFVNNSFTITSTLEISQFLPLPFQLCTKHLFCHCLVDSKSNSIKNYLEINRSIRKFLPHFFHSQINESFMRVGELLNVGKRNCWMGKKEIVLVS